MLSYTVNTTFRADEIFWDLDYENSNTWIGNGPNTAGRYHTSSDEYNNWAQHPPYGSQSATYSKPYYANAISCDDKVPDSKAPWEMGKFVEQIEILYLLKVAYISPGVVWSPSGPVAAGTMIAGLAAGLQPQSVSWPNGRVDNGWAASLAGDVAQTALLKVACLWKL